MVPKRTLPEVELRAIFLSQPDVTLEQLRTHFSCGRDVVARELKKYGLRTKSWSERKHTEATKDKISSTRKTKGLARGENNPNFGEKSRPWLEGDNHPFRQWAKANPGFGDRQRGSNNPIHKVRHLYDDPEYVVRITSGLRAHVRFKAGKTYEEVYGVEKAQEYKAKLRAASPARMSKFRRRATKPELAVRAILNRIGLDFIEQAPIGHYTVDFLVPERGLVVQADGDYWHANPRRYPESKLSKTQRKQVRLDASCDAYLKNSGYRVIRLWESDLRTSLPQCEQYVIEMVTT